MPIENDPYDMGDPDAHDCDCAHAVAQEFHEIAAALAARHGIDLCTDPPADDEDEAVEDLRIFHDLAVAHGADCPGDDPDDDGPDGIDEEGSTGEIPVIQFDDDGPDAAGFDDDRPVVTPPVSF
jgi:hypothetical protein